MRRDRGWGRGGERVYGRRPFRCVSASMIGAIRLGHRPKLMTVRRSVRIAEFLQFVRSRLRPWLKPGMIVVLDNLPVHRAKRVRAAIEVTGATVLFLPAYSPELNPIELWWADVKRQLRARALNALNEVLRVVRNIRAATREDRIRAWFRNALAHAQRK
jgi:transposase